MPTPLSVSLEVVIAAATAGTGGALDVLQRQLAERSQKAAEAAYSYQRETPLRLHPELAEILGHPRWPCFWGEEYTSDLSLGKGDGGYGYRTCGLRQLVPSKKTPGTSVEVATQKESTCVVYSFGCDGDYEFERAIASIYGARCELHIFDIFDPSPASNKAFEAAFEGLAVNVHFHQAALLDRNAVQHVQAWKHQRPVQLPTRTLAKIMSDLGHEHIDVLKMDIEGHEHRVLAQLWEAGWPHGRAPGQVYMEIHAQPTFPPYGGQHVQRMIKSLEDAGLRLFHAERPWRWCQQACMQLSFIHRDWLPGLKVYDAGIPHLKPSYNVNHRSDYFLFEFVKNGTKPLVLSRLTVLRPKVRWPTVVGGATFLVSWHSEVVGTEELLSGCCNFVQVGGTEGWRLPQAGDFSSDDDFIDGTIKVRQVFSSKMELRAPAGPPGVHWIRFQMRTRAGNLFGSTFQLSVFVVSEG
eukprot:TRINITY_DN102844_c0_g1_i1.p1 TRINITY_DN102844_c0_g1~~TRINITY_DN102844_c0_g1_i1.p1  ORF type:complete len:466 (+),score=90.71 TRINITY_DN102844_c0_g1_i1:84-1481(+)